MHLANISDLIPFSKYWKFDPGSCMVNLCYLTVVCMSATCTSDAFCLDSIPLVFINMYKAQMFHIEMYSYILVLNIELINQHILACQAKTWSWYCKIFSTLKSNAKSHMQHVTCSENNLIFNTEWNILKVPQMEKYYLNFWGSSLD